MHRDIIYQTTETIFGHLIGLIQDNNNNTHTHLLGLGTGFKGLGTHIC